MEVIRSFLILSFSSLRLPGFAAATAAAVPYIRYMSTWFAYASECFPRRGLSLLATAVEDDVVTRRDAARRGAAWRSAGATGDNTAPATRRSGYTAIPLTVCVPVLRRSLYYTIYDELNPLHCAHPVDMPPPPPPTPPPRETGEEKKAAVNPPSSSDFSLASGKREETDAANCRGIPQSALGPTALDC